MIEKKLRVNKKYGKWTYYKEFDLYDDKNYFYYLNGTDENGKDWGFSSPYYHELIEFAKANNKDKEEMIKYY